MPGGAPVVVPEEKERRGEDRDRDHDPDALPERVVGIETIDLSEPDRGQQAGNRQQVRVGERNRVARDEMRREVQHEEEPRIRQGGRRHDVLPRDVDAGEPDRRQDADDDQERELAVPQAQGQRMNLR